MDLIDDGFFMPVQREMLAAYLEEEEVKTREGARGRKFEYVEGWQVIAKANRIFGFGGWSSETKLHELHPPQFLEPTREHPRGQASVTYRAEVRITVYSIVKPGETRYREGNGVHRGIAPTVGEAFELAIKAAETDARKRALMSFGNPFGLALYDKSKKFVGKNAPEPAPAQRQIARQPLPAIDQGFDGEPAPREERMPISARASAGIRPPQVINGRAERAPAAIPY